ncbi:MAG: TonB-dependent receptor family protein [Hyphomicrobium sp.]
MLGSGLSRKFHLRGLQLYMDVIPINTADGFGDFQEIDPTAYRYIEVYKGANALRFGANSLGGAINFVMPTGYDSDLFGARFDVGSFGFRKVSASSGAVAGAADYAITGTWQEQDGYRDHSDGESVRGSLNIGYRITETLETRFYVNANDIEQRIPGAVTKETALRDPAKAAFINELNDWQRNVETVRVANKSTLRLGAGTSLEFGAFNVDRHLEHPIFRWLDYVYDDYGGFARLVDQRTIFGHENRFLIGTTLHDGKVDAQQFAIGPGAEKLNLLSQTDDRSENFTVYGENAFEVVPSVSLIAGLQYLYATRERDVVFSVVGDVGGSQSFDLWSPKAGILWDVDPGWQVFANVSESAEVPSFGENTVGGSAFTSKAQEAITYEIGTRGKRENFNWDVALYRAEIDDELQCLTLVFPFFTNTCAVTNADQTVHQGVELGFGAAIIQSVFAAGPNPDKLWLNTAYTLNDFHFDGDEVFGDNELPGAPRHFMRAELLYRHPSGVFFGPNVEWVPEAYYIDNANTLKTEGYAIWGAKLGYEGEKFSAYIEGRNLFDESYISSASVAGDLGGVDGNFFEPGTGAAVFGGVQAKW